VKCQGECPCWWSSQDYIEKDEPYQEIYDKVLLAEKIDKLTDKIEAELV
jgi:hypothetical protein